MGNALVSVEWLHKNSNIQNLVILDASSYSDAKDYNQKSIPYSRHFDLKGAFSNPNSTFPNTFPSENQFEIECQKLGINQSSTIVIFDNKGIFSSPRVWWMFKTMGHKKVYVLNGGLPEWITNGFEITINKKPAIKVGDFKANCINKNIKNYEDIIDNIETKTSLLIDARSSGRFLGLENEPRKYLQSGHIKNSINIPYSKVLNGSKFKSKEELKTVFQDYTNSNQNLIFSCGSGVTACIILLANCLVSNLQMSVYDGSWTEWATLQKLTNTKNSK